MNRNMNEDNLIVGKSGPVWTVKVGIYYRIADDRVKNKIRIKRWKIKEILN